MEWMLPRLRDFLWFSILLLLLFLFYCFWVNYTNSKTCNRRNEIYPRKYFALITNKWSKTIHQILYIFPHVHDIIKEIYYHFMIFFCVSYSCYIILIRYYTLMQKFHCIFQTRDINSCAVHTIHTNCQVNHTLNNNNNKQRARKRDNRVNETIFFYFFMYISTFIVVKCMQYLTFTCIINPKRFTKAFKYIWIVLVRCVGTKMCMKGKCLYVL